MLVLILHTGLLLAYCNGANDNFKGVATLFGSGTTDYRKALSWATITTFAGSILAVVLANGLVDTFKGKGLLPDSVIQQSALLLAVSLGVAMTVLIATVLGLPISTTHALTRGLVGAGLLATWFGTRREPAYSECQSKRGRPLVGVPRFCCGVTVRSLPVEIPCFGFPGGGFERQHPASRRRHPGGDATSRRRRWT